MDSRARLIGISSVACATLLAEVALTRILSVSLFHHVAFLIVSTALFGAGAAGLTVALSIRARRAATPSIALAGSLLFALGTPIAFLLSQQIDFEPMSLTRAPRELLRLAGTYLLYAIPFFGSGLVVSTLLDRHAEDAPRLYAFDLAGAGAGSFLSLLAVRFAHGPGALFVASAIGLVAAAAFSTRRGLRAGLVVLAIAVAASAPLLGPRLPLRISSTKIDPHGEPFHDVLRDRSRTRSTAWNSFARIDRVKFTDHLDRLIMDGGVAAVRIPPDAWIPAESETTLPYELSLRALARHAPSRPVVDAISLAHRPHVLIIGSGAGWEVAEALRFGARRVDAVEINPLIAMHTPRSLVDERVRPIVDEGRSYLERSQEAYDAIIMVHTISNAAVAGGALHLTEDYLLTAEAMDSLLGRLAPKGYLFITRPEAHLPRLLRTAADAHRRRGQDPTSRIVTWNERSPRGLSFYAGLLTSNSTISDGDLTIIRERVRSKPKLVLSVAPDRPPSDPDLVRALALESRDDSRSRDPTLRLDPATDDRPFFNQRRRFRDLTVHDLVRATRIGKASRMALEEQPLAELSVVILLVETTVIGALFLILPLIVGRRRRIDVSGTTRTASAVYYVALGAGFMLIEIALVQKLGLLLGYPALSFATVFAGLLIGAGAGSMLSSRVQRGHLAPLIATAWTAVLALAIDTIVKSCLPFALLPRVAAALAIVVPTGVVLGLSFPLGLLRTRRAAAHLVPWAFAINSVASIAGTVGALILATEIGFGGVLGVAASAYLAASIAFPYLEGGSTTPATKSPARPHRTR